MVEPIRELDKIEIVDNGEPLVSIAARCPHVHLSDEPDPWGRPRIFFVRRTVAEMLNRAQAALLHGCSLRVWSAFRTLDDQWRIYNEVSRRFRQGHPEWPRNILRRETNRFVHPPDAKTPPGHCTGGAIDLTVIGPDGQELDMNAPYGDSRDERRQVAATYDDKITEAAWKNRQLLVDVMSEAGFTNYAGEWWHWSYGDSCWAWRLDKTRAIYGIAQPTEEILRMLEDELH